MQKAKALRPFGTDPKVTAAPSAGVGVILTLFVLSLLIPASYELLGLRLSAERMMVLCAIIPLGVAWVSGKAGRIIPLDILMLLHALWMIIALVANHGTERFAYGGILFVELFGSYLIGRVLIQGAASYKRLFQLMLLAMLVLLPMALMELFSGRAYMQEFFRMALGSAHGDVDHPPRMGLWRVQSVMQHPILWGVFCSIAVVNAYHIWSHKMSAGLSRMGLAFMSSFFSLSSGALLASLLQVLLIAWGWLTRGAWKPLAIGFLSLYVFLSLASNRGPVIILIETLTFDPSTGWMRVHIWRHGIDDALANPIFGIGLNEHSRPYWLASSVDNFWLLTAMRYGIFSFLLLATGLIWHLYRIVTEKGLTDYEKRLREAYVIGLVSLAFALCTVHFWGPPYLLFFAYVGAGVWFYAPREDRKRIQEGLAEAHTDDIDRGAGLGEASFPMARRDPASVASARDTHAEHEISTKRDTQRFTRQGRLSFEAAPKSLLRTRSERGRWSRTDGPKRK